MRDWTKAMAALLAAVSSVCVVQALSAQDAPAPKPPAMRAADAADEPFAKEGDGVAPPAREMGKGTLTVSEDGSVDIKAVDASITTILTVLAEKTQKNIVCSKGVSGNVTVSLHHVTLTEALDTILPTNGLAYRQRGNFIYVYTIDELKTITKSERKLATDIFRLNYIPTSMAQDMLKTVLSPDAIIAGTKASANGLPSDASGAGGDSLAGPDTLIVTDYQDNIVEARRIIKVMDVRPQQILVEATIMVTKLKDNNSMGVDFTLLGGVDFSTLSNAGGASAAAGSSYLDSATGANVVNNGYNTVGTRNLPTQQQAGGLNVGVVTNNVAVFVNALEAISDSTVLANPKVLTLNKQPGAVIVGRKDGYLTTTTTSTSTVQSVEFLETGTRLIFRPYIADDGFIRMELHPEDSSATINQVGGSGVPSKSTTEVTTNVLVKDGHTIVIGGLFREENTISKSQVPLLGDIPLAGMLFKNQSDVSTRQEVILLITPHIIKDHAMYSEASEEMMKHTDLMRVGMRKGMMPWSRDRLAEMSYKTAREETAKKYYDRDRAMWYLDCATNLNPAFAEALVMKQKISGEQLMESDNSSMRHFLGDMVMDEQVGTTPAIQPPVMVPAPVSPATPVIVPVPEEKKATPPEVVPAPVPTPAPAPVEKAMEPKSDATPVEPAVKELPATTVAPDTGANK